MDCLRWMKLDNLRQYSFLAHYKQITHTTIPFFLALHCGPQHWRTRVSEGWWPDNARLDKCSGTSWTETSHKVSNITCFFVVKIDKFSSIYQNTNRSLGDIQIYRSNPDLRASCFINNYAVPETFQGYIYKLHLDQFAKMIIVFRVGTPYPIIFENLTQQCMVDIPTKSRLVHYIWTRFL